MITASPASWVLAWKSPVRSRALQLAVPIIFANISVPLVGIVDTAVMGRMADPDYMGAVALGAIIFSSIFWIFGFLRMGTGGLVAQVMGAASGSASDKPLDSSSRRATPESSYQHELALTLYRALLTALVLGLLILIAQKPIAILAMRAFSADSTLQALTLDYFFIRIFSAPATLLHYAVIGALIGLQQMRQVLYVQLLLNVGNVVLTLLLFAVFDAGIKGVALATVIAEYASLLYALIVLNKSTRIWPIRVKFATLLEPAPLRHLLAININLLIRTLGLTIAFYWLTESSLRIDKLTLAANAILIHMLHFSAHALDGFAHAAETLCGFAYGKAKQIRSSRSRAGDQVTGYENTLTAFHHALMVCTIWGVIFAVLFSIFYWLAGSWIINLMTNQLDVRAHAGQWLWWIILSPLVAIWGFLLDGLYIGVTHTRDMRNAMLQSVAVFLLANLLLIHWWGNTGLWMSYYVLMLARALTLWRYYPRILTAMRAAATSDLK